MVACGDGSGGRSDINGNDAAMLNVYGGGGNPGPATVTQALMSND